jgi:hypothetical protein
MLFFLPSPPPTLNSVSPFLLFPPSLLPVPPLPSLSFRSLASLPALLLSLPSLPSLPFLPSRSPFPLPFPRFPPSSFFPFPSFPPIPPFSPLLPLHPFSSLPFLLSSVYLSPTSLFAFSSLPSFPVIPLFSFLYDSNRSLLRLLSLRIYSIEPLLLLRGSLTRDLSSMSQSIFFLSSSFASSPPPPTPSEFLMNKNSRKEAVREVFPVGVGKFGWRGTRPLMLWVRA